MAKILTGAKLNFYHYFMPLANADDITDNADSISDNANKVKKNKNDVKGNWIRWLKYLQGQNLISTINLCL